MKFFLFTAKLALPISLARAFEMSMLFIDTLMLSELGKDALAVSAMAIAVWNIVAVFGIGFLFAFVPEYQSGANTEDRADVLRASFQFSFLFTIFCAAYLSLGKFWFHAFAQPADLIPIASKYLIILACGALLFFLNQVVRQLLECHQLQILGLFISMVSFAINFLGNYMLMYGKWGVPRLGVYGAAWSTVTCWLLTLVIQTLIAALHPRTRESFALSFKRLSTWFQISNPFQRLLRQGFPFGLSVLAEVAFFAVSALMIGRFGKTALAAHQIAINIASLTFMFAIGTSQAASLSLSQGNRRFSPSRTWVWSQAAYLVILAIMSIAAAVMMIFPSRIVAFYTQNTELAELAVKLLLIAALFQLMDGLQCVGVGILRGLHKGHAAAKNTFLAFWIVGFPSGYLLGNILHLETLGYWLGFLVGLTTAALLHFWTLKRTIKQMPTAKTFSF